MTKGLNSFSPDWVSPTGSSIQRLMNKAGCDRGELAEALNVSDEVLNKIINGEQTITKNMAHRLGSFFGPSHEFWLKREKIYRTEIVRLRKLRSLNDGCL